MRYSIIGKQINSWFWIQDCTCDSLDVAIKVADETAEVNSYKGEYGVCEKIEGYEVVNPKILYKTKKVKRGLLCWVYRSSLGDCTANGISSKFDKFVLIGEGIAEVFEPSENTPALYLIERTICHGEKLMQATPKEDGSFGMFGGNFIYSCDSRFPDVPLKIMDRFE